MPALPPGATTLLVMTGVALPPYSARGLTQTLEPADGGTSTMRRTVNGELINLSPPQFHKYKSKITGRDMDPPGMNGIFPGAEVTIDCIAEISYPTAGNEPNRPVVPGSSRDEAGHTFYRPRLQMLVTGYSVQTDEWGAAVSWSLDLEEV